MHNQLTKPILFCDFNGVISYNYFWHELSDSNHKLHQYYSQVRDLYTPQMAIDWMKGNYTTEQINLRISEQLSISYQDLLDSFIEGCRNIDISKPILGTINRLKAQYTCVLITDNMDSFDRFTLPSNPILQETFDYISNSYNAKLLKIDDNGQILVDICSRFNSDIKQSILIDDSPKNCNLFNNLGGNSVCVSGETKVVDSLLGIMLRIN